MVNTFQTTNANGDTVYFSVLSWDLFEARRMAQNACDKYNLNHARLRLCIL